MSDRGPMTPFLFGPPQRRQFGLLHGAQRTTADEPAVLLCNPLGQEAVRCHRLYRVLAERLAQQGLPTMRFDYHATGDSPGADEDGDLDGWAADVRVALRELKERSGAQRVVCVGARLGAVAAARAASGVDGLSRLVLWDPVVSGSAYLALLREKNVESLEASYSVADPAWRQDLANDALAFSSEAIGFAMSEALRRQLRKLGPHNLPLPPNADVVVVAGADDPTIAAWFEPHARQGTHRRWNPAQAFDWTAEESRNAPLVPLPLLTRLMSAVRD